MNSIINKTPTAKFEGFNGLWSNGVYSSTPQDHLTDCYNCIFPGKNQVTIREPFTVQNDLTTSSRTVISFAIAITRVGANLITLDSNGFLTDETGAFTLGGPFTGADDFTILNIFGRAYISLKKKGKAFPGGFTYYFDGLALFPTAGAAPPGVVTLAQPNVGTVDPGIHTVAVSFVTATGFLTRPCAVATITSTGVNTISISNIQTGPTGTLARVILVSKANESELFIAATINDNVTTIYEYTLFDTSLIASGDYLLNILTVLPSCAALKFYKGRMILIGQDTAPDAILASDISSPETVNLVNNVINLPVDFGINTSAGGMIVRDVLYLTKPNSTYSVQDNLGNPNTWGVSFIDSGIGAFDAGISVFASSMSAQDVLDSCLIINKRGLVFFNGTYSDPPLTYKIQAIWDKIDANFFYKAQVAHDIWYKRVYIALPLTPPTTYGDPIVQGNSGTNSLILMMDYKDGLTPSGVKWSVWTFTGKEFLKLVVENFTLNYTNASMIYQLAFCDGGPIIYKLNPPILVTPSPDVGHTGIKTSINQYIITAPVMPGGINTFTMLNLDVLGYGALTPSLYDKNRSIVPANLRTFNLQSYSNSQELQRTINFQSEGMQVQLKADQSLPSGNQGFFSVKKIEVYSNPKFNMRPALTESL